MSKTKIEWADVTWNPIIGCSHVSPGCDHCYAERMAHRLAGMGNDKYKGVVENGKWNGHMAFNEASIEKPLHWRKPRTIFVCSMSDLFHEKVPFQWITKVFNVMLQADQHKYIVLTKRPERISKWIDWALARRSDGDTSLLREHLEHGGNFPPHIMGMVTCENQAMADKRIPILLNTPFTYRGVSIEPMLGGIALNRTLGSCKLDYVVCGGESGPGARPTHPNWVRNIRNECKESNTPFMFKQWGEWATDCLCSTGPCKTIDRPVPGRLGCMFRCGKKRAGRLLDGVTHDDKW